MEPNLKTWNENTTNEMADSTCSPALLNDLILDCIFKYLNHKEIKECRIVCSRWNTVGEPILRKLSKITFAPPEKTFANFTSLFENSNSIPPSEVLKITSFDGSAWNIVDVDNIMEKFRNKLKFLTLLFVNVYEIDNDQKRILLNTYNINPQILSNLTVLEINGLNCSTKISVSLIANLSNLKYITLSFGVKLDIGDNEIKLTPTEINLHCCKFFQKGKKFFTVLLNDFIDFSQAKRVSASGSDYLGIPEISIDLRESISVDFLSLKKAKIVEEQDSQWTIEKMFCLDSIPWGDPNEMKYTNLDFRNCLMDITVLPSTIKNLRFSFYEDYALDVIPDEANENPIILENLKYLSIKTDLAAEENFLPLFKDCPNLTDVFIHIFITYGSAAPYFNINWLPKSVRRLEVCELVVKLPLYDDDLEYEYIELETLILSKLQADHYDNMFTPFRFKNLVICTDDYGDGITEQMIQFHLKELWKMIKYLQDNREGIMIFIGSLTLTKDSDTDFLECIDKSSINLDESTCIPQKYWLRFENGLGISIEEAEFNQVRCLVNSGLFKNEPDKNLYYY